LRECVLVYPFSWRKYKYKVETMGSSSNDLYLNKK
jgi:hypothetical protein